MADSILLRHLAIFKSQASVTFYRNLYVMLEDFVGLSAARWVIVGRYNTIHMFLLHYTIFLAVSWSPVFSLRKGSMNTFCLTQELAKEDNHELEGALGFPLFTEGDNRLGWLLNLNAVRPLLNPSKPNLTTLHVLFQSLSQMLAKPSPITLDVPSWHRIHPQSKSWTSLSPSLDVQNLKLSNLRFHCS